MANKKKRSEEITSIVKKSVPSSNEDSRLDDFILSICTSIELFDELPKYQQEQALIFQNRHIVDLRKNNVPFTFLENFEFAYGIYKEAKRASANGGVHSNEVTMMFIKKHIEERYPNIDLIYNKRKKASEVKNEKL